MIARRIRNELAEALNQFPAVALLGPRQVGKTTLAIDMAAAWKDEAVYLDLELPSDLAKLSDPELYLSAHERRLVVLDEIHRLPDIFQTLRAVIDQRRRKGISNRQFLLLGSASIDLLRQTAESLAGRIRYLELTPLLASEVPAGDQLWVRGGFPRSYLAPGDEDSFAWRTAFLRTYLERDLPALGPRIPAETLHRFWQMLAHNQGQLWNGSRLAASLGVSGQTVGRYLDVLVDLLLVRRLQPWMDNAGKRLVRSPKVYLRDSGIVHALLGIRNLEQLSGHPVVGASWEGYVIENILQAAPPGSTGWFYRTAAGAEIDLLLDCGAAGRWAIEVKRSVSSPQPGRGFYLACEDVAAARRFVVYPGTERYPIGGETEVLPLESLLGELGGGFPAPAAR